MKTLITSLLVVLSLSACSSGATFVRKDAIGGRVALDGAYMPAMRDARTLMTEHCKGRFAAHELGDSVEFSCRMRRASAAEVEVADVGVELQRGL